MAVPRTHYARSGDVNIAYQVVGDGPFDLVYVPGWISNIEQAWEDPRISAFLNRLTAFSRLLLFDKRGTGLSDRVRIDQLPTLEERMDDVRTVMDAAGSERAALLGVSEGGVLAALFAATYPERTSSLAIFGSYASGFGSDEVPGLMDPDALDASAEELMEVWSAGEAGGLLRVWAPSAAEDERARDDFGRYLRTSSSPSAAVALLRMNVAADITQAIPVIRAPTLVMHRTDDMIVPVECGRHLAEHIPDARYLELPGNDHLWYHGDWEAITDEVEEFFTGARPIAEPDRVLATVMFTDIVGSTEKAAEMGDSRWRELIERHDGLMREQIERHRGRTIKTMGDGVLATFDGPARAIRCACDAREAVRPLGVEIRAGLHTGECELIGDDVGGIAVNIGARVGAKAGPGEVLVSRTVTDLVAGSGIEFSERGSHALKGVPGKWELYAVS
jgi:class 3 adenylate cyclase